MLTNKITYTSNISSNMLNMASNSSVVPNTLFELMRTNILIVDNNVGSISTKNTFENIQKEEQ